MFHFRFHLNVFEAAQSTSSASIVQFYSIIQMDINKLNQSEIFANISSGSISQSDDKFVPGVSSISSFFPIPFVSSLCLLMQLFAITSYLK